MEPPNIDGKIFPFHKPSKFYFYFFKEYFIILIQFVDTTVAWVHFRFVILSHFYEIFCF